MSCNKKCHLQLQDNMALITHMCGLHATLLQHPINLVHAPCHYHKPHAQACKSNTCTCDYGISAVVDPSRDLLTAGVHAHCASAVHACSFLLPHVLEQLSI